MKEFQGLVANNQVEEKILDVANLANKMSKELDKMCELLCEIGKTRTYCISDSVEVSEVFKDLLEELSEVSYKGSIALDILSRFGK